MLITFEGGEGSGKTTIMAAAMDYLHSKGVDLIRTREPGGVHIAEQIRNVILDKGNTAMHPRTEALLFAAARCQHLVEVIEPAIAAGKVVLCDRFIDSSLVYQGHARGIGASSVLDINMFATRARFPDVTFLLDVDPQVGLERIANHRGREFNRLDAEELAFHEKVREGYNMLAEIHPRRVLKIDANQPIDDVVKVVRDHLDAIFAFQK